MKTGCVVWLRNDLRLHDNPALCAAVEHGGPVYPLFIQAPHECADWTPGGAANVWLHASLAALAAALTRLNSRLIVRSGDSLAELEALIDACAIDAVLWNRRYEPAGVAVDMRVKQALKARGIVVRSFKAALLYEPQEVRSKSGTPFRVFTPFWRHLRTLPPPAAPLPAPTHLQAPAHWPPCASLDALQLRPSIKWDAGIVDTWQIGEQAACAALHRFAANNVEEYATQRDQPGTDGTSRLSPHLHFGELSPRQAWAYLQSSGPAGLERAEPFVRQLAWREFAHHLLFNHPHTDLQPLDARFTRFPWRTAAEESIAFRAWRRGMTGYPLVDAGMRQLYLEGWMHNRVRMVAASFLVKHLLIRWQDGARWFWHTLVDANLANNTMGWQWTAGCGADAAPYFRVFNPTLQAERFDATGAYIRRYVPELSKLEDKWIVKPMSAPAAQLAKAGVVLGETYPLPIVDHADARQRALVALESIRSG